MGNSKNIPSIVGEISLKKIKRIDSALEGDWNSTLVTIWTPDKGMINLSKVIRVHPEFKPSLELYFEDAWIGFHCYKRTNGEYVFDEKLAKKIIHYVETNLV
jgi:hypothetical protein